MSGWRSRTKTPSATTACARGGEGLPPLAFAPTGIPIAAPSGARRDGLARIDTLLLAGLDSEAQAEVRFVLSRPPPTLDALLGWTEGLSVRGYGSAAVRLGWQAALQAPGDARVLRAIFPWPNRSAVEAEAEEFGVDALLLAALVRKESVFDVEALSPQARGPRLAAAEYRRAHGGGLDVAFYPTGSPCRISICIPALRISPNYSSGSAGWTRRSPPTTPGRYRCAAGSSASARAIRTSSSSSFRIPKHAVMYGVSCAIASCIARCTARRNPG